MYCLSMQETNKDGKIRMWYPGFAFRRLQGAYNCMFEILGMDNVSMGGEFHLKYYSKDKLTITYNQKGDNTFVYFEVEIIGGEFCENNVRYYANKVIDVFKGRVALPQSFDFYCQKIEHAKRTTKHYYIRIDKKQEA